MAEEKRDNNEELRIGVYVCHCGVNVGGVVDCPDVAEYAWEKGIIIADTKFEFGLDEQGRVVIGDEMLTPDSSRFWPREGYEAGKGQPSYDKQFVRDWLKQNPDSDYDLPGEVIDKTVAKYKEAYEQLTGEEFK